MPYEEFVQGDSGGHARVPEQHPGDPWERRVPCAVQGAGCTLGNAVVIHRDALNGVGPLNDDSHVEPVRCCDVITEVELLPRGIHEELVAGRETVHNLSVAPRKVGAKNGPGLVGGKNDNLAGSHFHFEKLNQSDSLVSCMIAISNSLIDM